MIEIDGSEGEGGGQILRTSLALALATGQTFRITGIRAGRAKPGLLRQHLTAVQAAAEVGGARVEGDALGSRELSFHPGPVRGGRLRFAVGTAGSATLVVQAVLPALLGAPGPSELRVEGGTHNMAAPPFDFLARSYLPLLGRMGARVEARLERHGFYPAGGGALEVRVEPTPRLAPLALLERGALGARRARALLSKLPRSIGERELKVVAHQLGWDRECLAIEEVKDSPGPGNVLVLEMEGEGVTEVVTGFGERGVRAEEVARRAVEAAREWLAAGVPVGEHLQDQLLLPLALAGGGSFRTLPLTRHAITNVGVIRRFLEVDVQVEREGARAVRVEVRGRG